MPKTRSLPYPALRLWLRSSGSYHYYIDAQVERAKATNAPADALYEKRTKGGERTGEWVCVSDLDEDHRLRAKLEEAGIA